MLACIGGFAPKDRAYLVKRASFPETIRVLSDLDVITMSSEYVRAKASRSRSYDGTASRIEAEARKDFGAGGLGAIMSR